MAADPTGERPELAGAYLVCHLLKHFLDRGWPGDGQPCAGNTTLDTVQGFDATHFAGFCWVCKPVKTI